MFVSKFISGAPPSYLLDTYSNAILALSNRQLKTGVTNVIRARDSGDSSEADYTPAQITAGYTAIGADSGFAAKLYDQASVVGELVQTAAASQMRVLNAGSLETLNGLPAWNNASAFGAKTASSVSLSTYDELWFFVVLERPTSGGDMVIFETSASFNGANGALVFYFLNASTLSIEMRRNDAAIFRIGRATITATGQVLITGRFIANTSSCYELYVNGVALSVTYSGSAASSTNLTNQTVNFGARNGGSLRLPTKIQEGIIFSGDQTSNRAGIESEINTYYGIY